MIDLWPNVPFESVGTTGDKTRNLVFPSGRQAVLFAVDQLAGARDGRIALPDYSSHCLISIVAKKITPLPISSAICGPESIDIVLFYSQWGWERPLLELEAAIDTFPNAALIMDRVDSMGESLASLPECYASPDIFQVFSLNKLLGIGGGGLVARGDDWQDAEKGNEEEREVCRVLSELKKSLGASPEADLVQSWELADIGVFTPELAQWLDANNLAHSIRDAAAARRSRIETLAAYKDRLKWPQWMCEQLQGQQRTFPGIAPLFVRDRGIARDLARTIGERIGIRVADYHFDKSPSYTKSDWTPCIAVPLHWQVPIESLERIIDYWVDTAE